MTSPEAVIRFQCDGCGKQLKALPAQVGSRVRCPGCQHSMLVPPQTKPDEADEYRLLDEADQSGTQSAIVSGDYVSTHCPRCRTLVSARLDQVGEQVACPDCHSKVTIPPPPRPAEKKPAPDDLLEEIGIKDWQPDFDATSWREPIQIPVICPLCHTRMHAPATMVGERIPCPDCGTKAVVPPLPEDEKKRVFSDDFSDDLLLSAVVERPKVKDPLQEALDDIDLDHGREDVGSSRKGRVQYEHRESKVPDLPLLSGIYTIPVYPGGAWAQWLWMSATLMVVLYLASVAIAFAADPSVDKWIATIFISAMTMAFALMWAVSTSARLLAIMQETAAGVDVIEGWPESMFLDWIGDFFYILNATAMSAIPGVVVAALLGTSPLDQAIYTSASVLIFFPLFVLSMFESVSPFIPFSTPVWGSLIRSWWAWLIVLVEVAVLAAATLGTVYLLERVLGLWAIMPGSFVIVGAAMIYFRLLGRLAWYCAPPEDREQDADEDADETTGKAGPDDSPSKMQPALRR